jgi:hypothetical protein
MKTAENTCSRSLPKSTRKTAYKRINLKQNGEKINHHE